MNFETTLVLAASVLGLTQVILSSRHHKFPQIQRNFSETYFVVIVCFLITLILGGGGSQAVTAASFYFVGRIAYVALTLIDQPNVRKYAWAISMVGVIGWTLVAIKAVNLQIS